MMMLNLTQILMTNYLHSLVFLNPLYLLCINFIALFTSTKAIDDLESENVEREMVDIAIERSLQVGSDHDLEMATVESSSEYVFQFIVT